MYLELSISPLFLVKIRKMIAGHLKLRKLFEIDERLFEIGERLFEIGERLFEIGLFENEKSVFQELR